MAAPPAGLKPALPADLKLLTGAGRDAGAMLEKPVGRPLMPTAGLPAIPPVVLKALSALGAETTLPVVFALGQLGWL